MMVVMHCGGIDVNTCFLSLPWWLEYSVWLDHLMALTSEILILLLQILA